jgi:8-oxo-dGTP pyrophosphatase MutT (NUDIX family)
LLLARDRGWRVTPAQAYKELSTFVPLLLARVRGELVAPDESLVVTRRAIREFQEETQCSARVTFFDAPSRHGGYALYYGEVDKQFVPVLNEEHTDFAWARPDDLPLPLHRGLRYQIRKLGVV